MKIEFEDLAGRVLAVSRASCPVKSFEPRIYKTISLVEMKIITLALSLLGLIACNQENKFSSHESLTSDTVSTQTLPTKEDVENIPQSRSRFSLPDTSSDTKVLTVGTFHNDEVWEGAHEQSWFGLFKGNGSFYLAPADVKIIRVNDPMLDREGEKTGWQVSTDRKDNCLILIEERADLEDRIVQEVPLISEFVYPNDTVKLEYLNVQYEIFATGQKKKYQDNPKRFDVWHYKLYLKAKINGQEKKTLLISQPDFDDQMVNIVFAGDIDGDGILDLIIDTSRHYNVTSPTVYFSKPASRGEVVKIIGSHMSVGC